MDPQLCVDDFINHEIRIPIKKNSIIMESERFYLFFRGLTRHVLGGGICRYMKERKP